MVGDDLYDFAKTVSSRGDFIRFVSFLNKDLTERRDEWGNTSLDQFLSGLSSFAEDMDGYYKNMGETVNIENITWRMAAEMLLAATVYGG